MIEWHIQSRAHACKLSGRQFHDGETYHTLLLDTKAGFERMDLCVDAFKESAAELLAKVNLVSHWKGVYEAPPPVPPDAIRKDDAESLLRKLLERREERHSAVAYILAVMLERSASCGSRVSRGTMVGGSLCMNIRSRAICSPLSTPISN